MNITMWGTSDSGKTTYLSALLDSFCNRGVEGFRFAGINQTEERKLQQTMYEIGTLFSKLTFPKATEENIIDTLQLQLKKANKKVIDFNLIDYKGENLPLAAFDDQEEIVELSNNLLRSDVIIIFADAISLKCMNNDTQLSTKLGVAPMTSIFENALKNFERFNKKIPVIFALTKFDSSVIEEKDIDGVKDKLKNQFSGIIDMLCDHGCPYVIMPIGVVGRGVVNTQVIWKGNELIVTNNIQTNVNFAPINVAALFAQAMLMYLNTCQQNIENYKQLGTENQKELNNVIKVLLDILIGHSQRRNLRKDLNDIIEYTEVSLGLLNEYVNDLKRIAKQGR